MHPISRPAHSQDDPPSLGEFEGYAVYPMPAFARLAASDVAATADFFSRVLDFDVMFRGAPVGGMPSLVHVRRGKYRDLLIVPASGPISPGSSITVTFGIAEADELDALAARVAAAAPGVLDGPADTPWNTREFSVRDPDGNRFTFTTRAREFRPGFLEELAT